MQRVLITGGAGFIGSHLAERLIKEGNDVVIIDNLLTGKIENVPEHADFIEMDITNRQDMIALFGGEFDIVMHCAASYDQPDNHQRNIMTNALGSKIVADLSALTKVKKMIYFQTSLCYGRPRTYPIGVNHQIQPICSYAISKTAGEFYIRSSGVPFLVFRLANMYGPRNLTGPVPIFYKNLRSNIQSTVMKNARRDYCYISDLVDLVMIALKREGAGIFHAASQSDIAIEDLFKLMKALTGGTATAKEIEMGPNDVEHLFLDSSQTELAFNWKAQVQYPEGLRKTIDWYDAQRTFDTFTHMEKPK